VRDEAPALDGEDEVVRRLRVPGLVAFRGLQRVERSVDLDRVDLPRRVLQFPLLRPLRRIKRASPRAVRPTRNADARLLGHGSECSGTTEREEREI
jgi:hypothetical protein